MLTIFWSSKQIQEKLIWFSLSLMVIQVPVWGMGIEIWTIVDSIFFLLNRSATQSI
jgi:hypothetical protein